MWYERREMLKAALVHCAAAALCALFGAVYELFSHGVYSYFMLYAFALPLVLGALPTLVLALREGPRPRPWARRLWHGGVAALTVGCLFEGVLRIYGTESVWALAYLGVGAAMLLAGGALALSAGEGKE